MNTPSIDMLTQLHTILYQLYYQQPILWYSAIGILGAIAGSFINMLCHRLPIMLKWDENDENPPLQHASDHTPHQPKPMHTLHSPTILINLFTPRSFCLHCHKTLLWWHNIPLISYLILKGKCYFCRQSVATSYFYIELASVILSLVTAMVISHPIYSLWWCLFVWLGLSLCVFDCRYLLLPDSLNYTLLWSGLLFAVVTGNSEVAILSACIGYLTFAIINTLYKWIRQRDGIGQGDFKLLAGIAAWISWYELPSVVLISASLGLTYALVYFLKNNMVDLKFAVPFAPFLLISTWLWMIFLHLSEKGF